MHIVVHKMLYIFWEYEDTLYGVLNYDYLWPNLMISAPKLLGKTVYAQKASWLQPY